MKTLKENGEKPQVIGSVIARAKDGPQVIIKNEAALLS